MEININKEIRDYTEAVFFGLNTRQLVCSALAIGAAVAIYFGFKETVSKDFITYLCIAAASPFAAIGFVKYNGMPLEKIIVAWVKDNFIIPRRLTCSTSNLYREVLRTYLQNLEKEGLTQDAKELDCDTEAG